MWRLRTQLPDRVEVWVCAAEAGPSLPPFSRPEWVLEHLPPGEATARHGWPDLVLLDATADPGGAAATSTLLRQRFGRTVGIVLVTGDADAARATDVDLVLRPSDLPGALSRLEMLLARARHRRRASLPDADPLVAALDDAGTPWIAATPCGRVLGTGHLPPSLREARHLRALLDAGHSLPPIRLLELGVVARLRSDQAGRPGFTAFAARLEDRPIRVLHGAPPAHPAAAASPLAVAAVVHDLNNLLAVAQVHLDLLEDDLPSDHRGMQDLRDASSALGAAGRLARSVLELARARDAAPTTDLVAWCREDHRLFETLAGPEVAVLLDLPPRGFAAAIPPVELQRIAVNLVKNAARACRGGGCIVLRVRDAGAEEVALEVEDDGPGMPEAVRRRVLEPGFTTRPGQGYGLGLAACAGIAARRGGRVEIESGPGRGTRVRVLLPRATRSEPDEPVPRRGGEPPDPAGNGPGEGGR